MQFIDNEASASGSESSGNSQPSQQELAERAKTFNINRKRFLLTYTKFNETPENILDILNKLRPIHRAIACRELHQDGEPHLHVAVEFVDKVHSSNPRFFDVGGCHPNDAGAPRSWGACVNYCKKRNNEDVVYYGAANAEGVIRSAGGESGSKGASSTIFDKVSECSTFIEWLRVAVDARLPFGYAKAYWDAVTGPASPTFTENEPLPRAVTDPELRTRVWGDSERTLVICGPSGIGKTCWALANAPVPFLFVTHIDLLKRYDARIHKSIVFDEIRCTGARDESGRRKGQWPLTEQIKLLTWDTPVSIHTRYVAASLPRHVVKIFTCTDTICFTRDPQTARRMRVWNLYNSIENYKDDDDLWES